ncbi:MAG: hypothetical protein Q7S83_02400 [bacterium]|nr:hypothetical protein [bacterium]
MKKIDKQGSHTFMSPEEIEDWYRKLEVEHATYLAKYGVRFPKWNTTKALWLIFLRKYQGKPVHKDTISSFVETVMPKIGKDQQVRHLAGDGWYILNRGDKLPEKSETVPSGYHILITTESPKPSFLFKSLKRAGRLAAKDFESLKAVYDFRCATCGSQERKPNFLEPDKRTTLQQGHMNPLKPLSLENSIPQCQVCNGVYKDDYVFDAKGRAIAVASPRPVLKADKAVQEQIKKLLG